MKAIVLHEYGGPNQLKLEDVPDPKPGEAHSILSTMISGVIRFT